MTFFEVQGIAELNDLPESVGPLTETLEYSRYGAIVVVRLPLAVEIGKIAGRCSLVEPLNVWRSRTGVVGHGTVGEFPG